MSEHREWSAEKGMGLFSTEIAEHNATVRAYRDAMAECERLGKANDEACGQIFDLEQGIASANEALKAELTALKVRVTPHDEQRSECWQILNDALLGLCPTMNLAHAVREAIDTLKARVEELESDLNSVTKHQELCAAKNLEYSAELEAVTAERDELKKSSELLAVVYQGEMDARKSAQSELAALRQRDTVPVKVRWDVTAAEVENKINHLHFVEDYSIVNRDAIEIMDYLAAHAVIDVPEGVPSVEELAALADAAYCEVHDIGGNWGKRCPEHRQGEIKAAEAILTALRPWLREPTGWELDVTAEDVYEYWAEMEGTETAQGAIDFIKSRIRPTFECAECAKKDDVIRVHNKHLEIIQGRLRAARAVLEGE